MLKKSHVEHEKNTLSVVEAAAMLEKSEMTVWRYLRSGRLTRLKNGMNETRVDRDEVQALLQVRPVDEDKSKGKE